MSNTVFFLRGAAIHTTRVYAVFQQGTAFCTPDHILKPTKILNTWNADAPYLYPHWCILGTAYIDTLTIHFMPSIGS